MNPHQTPADFYSAGYPGTLNRSPSSTRGGFSGAPGMPSSMGGGRRGQQALDPLGQTALFADDRYHPFDATTRFDAGRSSQNTLQGGGYAFGGANQAAWGMNHGGAATMSGPLNDGTRMRNRNVRSALPSAWTSNESGQNNPNNSASSFYSSQHLPSDLGLSSGGMHGHYQMAPPEVSPYQTSDMRSYGDPKLDNDLIPTAIVIKNIPFNVRKEVLTAAMVEANLPQPYAFNYHFDQGVFRGLAFANFQSAQDTDVVIQYMNGLEVGGRKLRVEYKKMLPEHERERIEREKREKRGQLEEQHRAPTHQLSMNSLAAAAAARQDRYDLNDPNTLKFYLKLYMFRTDETQEVVIFPSETSPEDRRLIHTLAHNMGLEHSSTGEGENRQIHVSKSKFSPSRQTTSHLQHPGLSLDGHPKGLSRAATYDFNERHHPPLHSVSRQTLAVPGSPDGQYGPNGLLRGVKSFADLRSFSPSPSPSVVSNQNTLGGPPGASLNYLSQFASDVPFGPSLTNPTTLGGGMNPASAAADPTSLVAGMNSLGLGGSPYDMANTHLGRGRDAPGAIGSQRPGANGLRTRDNPERQPRGPTGDWESAGGFNSRGRPNGHMTRGSDSSDPGRLTAVPGSSIPHQ